MATISAASIIGPMDRDRGGLGFAPRRGLERTELKKEAS